MLTIAKYDISGSVITYTSKTDNKNCLILYPLNEFMQILCYPQLYLCKCKSSEPSGLLPRLLSGRAYFIV